MAPESLAGHFYNAGMRLALVVTALGVVLSLAGCGSAATVAPTTVAAVTEPAVAESTVAAATAVPAAGGMGGRGGPGLGVSVTAATPVVKDGVYASVSAAQKLDLYVPEGSGPFPLIVVVHGGGFMMGDKGEVPGIDALLAAGYAVASVNYRLSGEALYPAQIQDVKAAVRWLRAHAGEYNLNPDKFGAWGASAGGNLVSLLGTSCGVAALEGADLGNADQSSCVQAVVDWFGPIDFLQMDTQFSGTSCAQDHNAASSPESMLVGGPIQDNPEAVKAANPITYVSAKAPAFFIEHGTADCNVPPQQSQLLYDALKATIGEGQVTLTYLEGAGHGGSQFETAENMKLVTDFLDKYLKQ